jgi:error-prone DNA polymerase
MGFYPPDALVHEAQRRGIYVLPPDANRSQVLCHVEALPTLGVRVGLGYVNGVAEKEMEALVAERERGGQYEGIGDLASRSGVGRDGLEKLTWAGALDAIGTPGERREALWRLGTLRGSAAMPAGTQLALPLEAPAAPALPSLGRWERVLADYRSTGMTLGDHPMELLREELGPEVALAVELETMRDGGAVEVAGMVVARQRPATAKGVVFMLLEDESGTINLVIPPPVFERHRVEVRATPLLRASGRLERRQGAINVVVSRLARLERPDLPLAEVRTIEPPIGRETGGSGHGDWEPIPDELAAVAPAAHSFGRRGR